MISALPSDPELLRLDGLASKAIAAGDFRLGYKYRQQETMRAGQIEKGLDQQQSKIDAEQAVVDQKRRELASVYARTAEAAMYTLQPEAEAAAYTRAAEVSKLLDPAISQAFRLRAAEALSAKAHEEGDPQFYQQAVPIYRELLKETDPAARPQRWAQIAARLAWAQMWTADRTEDQDLRREAVVNAAAALKTITPQTAYDDWFKASMALTHADTLLRDFDAAKAAAQAFVDGMPVSNVPDLVQAKGQYANVWMNFGDTQAGQPVAFGQTVSFTPTGIDAYSKAAAAFAEAALLARHIDPQAVAEMQEQSAYSAMRVAGARGDLPAVKVALALGRDALSNPLNKGIGGAHVRQLMAYELAIAGQAADDQGLMKEALVQLAKVEKLAPKFMDLGDYRALREADGVLLATLGKENRDRASLEAALGAFNEAARTYARAGWSVPQAGEEVAAVQRELGALDK